jgi:hypothetical protein
MLKAGFDKPLTNNSEKIEHYTKKYKLDTLSADAKNCSSASNTKDLQKSKNDMISKIEADINIPTNEKEDLKKQLDSLVYTRYGSQKESEAIDIYSKTYGVKVVDKQKCIKKLFSSSGNINWYIIGKLDGLTEDGSTIIEIKNRTKALFKMVVDYEKIQMMTYMKLFQKQKCNLVECLDSKVLNVIEIQYDENFWNMIDLKLANYVKFMAKFMGNQTEMIQLLTATDDTYQKYYLDCVSKF